MKDFHAIHLPPSWALSPLSDVAAINPKLDKADFIDSMEVSFIPMPAVEAGTGVVNVTEKRPFGEVKKGYTAFREGDVLFAKITPCMENGKMAVVPRICNGIAFGSTEFHVLRARIGINARYIYYFISSQRFRYDAEHNMTGAVGQRRVPTSYLTDHLIPIPPSGAQMRIVAKIEELFSELDTGLDSLRTAQQQLKVYRHALLKYAFEGRLTAHWREQNKEQLEPGNELLARINHEREARYQIACREWREVYSAWEASGQGGRRPPRPIKPTEVVPIDIIDDIELPELPYGWLWLRYGDLCALVRNGISKKPDGTQGAKIFRISAVRPMEFDLTDFRYLKNSTGEYDSYYLASGDLIFTRYNGSRAYVGVCAEYKGNGETHVS